MLVFVVAGSRGDIGPVLGLAAAAQERGHAVRVVSSHDAADLAEKLHVPFVDLGFSVADLMRSPAGLQSTGSSFASRQRLVAAASQLIEHYGEAVLKALEGASLVLTTDTVFLLGQLAAERQQVPQVCLCFNPYGRTATYRSFFADAPGMEAMSNLETHDAVQLAHAEGLLTAVNPLRARHGLATLTPQEANAIREATPCLMGYSRAICPPPSDWPANRVVTGFWPCPVDDVPVPPEARRFLENGPPPVFVGFGSMVNDTDALLRLLVEVNGRFLVGTGWSDRPRLDLPERILVVGGIDHRWTFPRCAATLHHGGAGTTATALAAGVPSLIAWFMMDQVFWASTVERLGAGKNLGPYLKLTPQALADALQSMSPNMFRLPQEDGIANALDAIERMIICNSVS